MKKRQLLKEKAERLTESEVAEVLEYIAIMGSLNDRMKPEPLDELILQLLSESLHGAIRAPQRFDRFRERVRN